MSQTAKDHKTLETRPERPSDWDDWDIPSETVTLEQVLALGNPNYKIVSKWMPNKVEGAYCANPDCKRSIPVGEELWYERNDADRVLRTTCKDCYDIEAYKAFCADYDAVRLRLAREHDALQREAWGG